MERLVLTADGSHTLFNATLNQTYHSIDGALQESLRVFIELGLYEIAKQKKAINLLEMGFGTGLNALLTLEEAEKLNLYVHYTGIEAYPISVEEAKQLNYDAVLQTQYLLSLHKADWEREISLTPFFRLLKKQTTLQHFVGERQYDLVYFDAFAPKIQPELWTVEVFEKLALIMPSGGILTTYSSKGQVRRNLLAAGFWVEKHPGPGKKQEVVRAIKQ